MYEQKLHNFASKPFIKSLTTHWLTRSLIANPRCEFSTIMGKGITSSNPRVSDISRGIYHVDTIHPTDSSSSTSSLNNSMNDKWKDTAEKSWKEASAEKTWKTSEHPWNSENSADSSNKSWNTSAKPWETSNKSWDTSEKSWNNSSKPWADESSHMKDKHDTAKSTSRETVDARYDMDGFPSPMDASHESRQYTYRNNWDHYNNSMYRSDWRQNGHHEDYRMRDVQSMPRHSQGEYAEMNRDNFNETARLARKYASEHATNKHEGNIGSMNPSSHSDWKQRNQDHYGTMPNVLTAASTGQSGSAYRSQIPRGYRDEHDSYYYNDDTEYCIDPKRGGRERQRGQMLRPGMLRGNDREREYHGKDAFEYSIEELERMGDAMIKNAISDVRQFYNDNMPRNRNDRKNDWRVSGDWETYDSRNMKKPVERGSFNYGEWFDDHDESIRDFDKPYGRYRRSQDDMPSRYGSNYEQRWSSFDKDRAYETHLLDGLKKKAIHAMDAVKSTLGVGDSSSHPHYGHYNKGPDIISPPGGSRNGNTLREMRTHEKQIRDSPDSSNRMAQNPKKNNYNGQSRSFSTLIKSDGKKHDFVSDISDITNSLKSFGDAAQNAVKTAESVKHTIDSASTGDALDYAKKIFSNESKDNMHADVSKAVNTMRNTVEEMGSGYVKEAENVLKQKTLHAMEDMGEKYLGHDATTLIKKGLTESQAEGTFAKSILDRAGGFLKHNPEEKAGSAQEHEEPERHEYD